MHPLTRRSPLKGQINQSNNKNYKSNKVNYKVACFRILYHCLQANNFVKRLAFKILVKLPNSVLVLGLHFFLWRVVELVLWYCLNQKLLKIKGSLWQESKENKNKEKGNMTNPIHHKADLVLAFLWQIGDISVETCCLWLAWGGIISPNSVVLRIIVYNF